MTRGHVSKVILVTEKGNVNAKPAYQSPEQVQTNYPRIEVTVSGSSAICKSCNEIALRAARTSEEVIKKVAALYEE